MLHSQDNLSKLRIQLAQLNFQLFDLLEQRRILTRQVQAAKGPDITSHYDAQREKQLFSELLPVLTTLSLKELAGFSLIMESQAGSPHRYPAWSEGVHIQGPGLRVECLINPLLLKIIHPDIFKTLKLKTDFSFLLSI